MNWLNLSTCPQSELTVELEAERKSRQTKQNALQMTTEEISRANSIISIQVKELSQLKKKVETRTDIALQQEKAVKMLEQENETLRNKLKEVFMNSDNQQDVSKRLEELRIGTDELEQKYSKSKWMSGNTVCSLVVFTVSVKLEIVGETFSTVLS